MKKLALLLPSMILLIGLFTCISVSAAASGDCGADGNNLTWELTDDGTLTISGAGKMVNYFSSSGTPWYSVRNSINSVVINEGVTSLGNYVFSNLSGLTGVTIPDSVTTIGYYAFESCTGLTSVTIPDSVTTIGYYAFESCTGLTSVTIPDSVTTIGYYAFYSCTGLTSVTIPDSVTTIGDFAFNSCIGLTDVTIGNGVKTIGVWAFDGCDNLTTVNYIGTAEQWNGIIILANNGPLTNATKNYVTTIVSKQSTCTEAGYKAYYEFVGKNFEDAKCTTEIPDLDVWKAEGGGGYIAPLGHDFTGEWESNDTQHWHVCQHADCDVEDTGINHVFDKEVADEKYLKSEATCTDKAVYYLSCECGEFVADEANTFEGEALGHTGGTATCTAKAVCDRCQQEYGEKNLSNHVGGTETRNAKTATCTAEGYTGDECCISCNAVLTAGSAISKISHNFGTEWKSDNGGHWHICGECTATDIKVPHVWENNSDTKCDICGFTRTVETTVTEATTVTESTTTEATTTTRGWQGGGILWENGTTAGSSETENIGLGAGVEEDSHKTDMTAVVVAVIAGMAVLVLRKKKEN